MWQTLALARELGVPVPRSHLVETVAEAHALAAEFSWPVVIKPQRSRLVDATSGVDVLEVAYATSPTDLVRVMSRFEGRCAVLLQEYCPGEGHGVELLAYEGIRWRPFSTGACTKCPSPAGPARCGRAWRSTRRSTSTRDGWWRR